MGIPSIGIYCYELFKFYDVDTIIRIGSCGGVSPDLELFDVVLADKAYTESNFALSFGNEANYISEASNGINDIIEETAKDNNIKCVKGTTLSNECFDPYTEGSKILERAPKDLDIIASEMEAFSLFYIAKKLNKKAACIITVVDSPYSEKHATVEERQNSLNNMIKLSLESAIKM